MTHMIRWDDLGPVMVKRLQVLREKETGGITDHVQDLVRDCAQEMTPTQILDAAHRLQRFESVMAFGLHDDVTILEALDDVRHFPTWKNYVALDASEKRLDALGHLMYAGDPERRAPIFMQIHDYTRGIAERVLMHCMNDKASVDMRFVDFPFDRRVYGLTDAEHARAYGLSMGARCVAAARIISLQANSGAIEPIDSLTEKAKESGRAMAMAFGEVRRTQAPNQFYTLTTVPTPQDAEMDKIAYKDYVDLYFRMCDVDWKKVEHAHRILIAKLDAGKILRITNNDGTDVSMNIDGFTFANSCVAKNVPGSEVFSAPRRDSVEGVIVAKGRFAPRDNHQIIENITMEFEKGYLVRASAEKGDAIFQAVLNTDEGARYVGEIGIGTNPVLQQHVVNGLLVEKIGGSFHVALGKAYEYTDYLGVPVNVDNGNRSAVHWDITTMLVGKQGMMFLDGDIIMRDGKFVDQALSILNA